MALALAFLAGFLVGDGLFVGGFCGVLLLFFGLLDCFFWGRWFVISGFIFLLSGQLWVNDIK